MHLPTRKMLISNLRLDVKISNLYLDVIFKILLS